VRVALRHCGFQANHYGGDQHRPGNPGWRTYIDAGGWATLLDLIEYYNGYEYEDECNRAANS
jgi:hypothetical protein